MVTNFILPFNGLWLTFWGGDSLAKNIHHGTTSQKYAFDFIKTNENNKFFRTNGKTNEDYFVFGLDIITPADGVVVEVVDGLRDNKPGDLNSFNYLGNYVMLKHQPKVYSVLGHLRQNSTQVKAGDKVIAGQKLGVCGNSGYSTDPHLHFHVQNSDIFARVDKNYKRIDIAKGQKVYFKQIKIIEGDKEKIKHRYSPIKGDIIGNNDEG